MREELDRHVRAPLGVACPEVADGVGRVEARLGRVVAGEERGQGRDGAPHVGLLHAGHQRLHHRAVVDRVVDQRRRRRQGQLARHRLVGGLARGVGHEAAAAVHLLVDDPGEQRDVVLADAGHHDLALRVDLQDVGAVEPARQRLLQVRGLLLAEGDPHLGRSGRGRRRAQQGQRGHERPGGPRPCDRSHSGAPEERGGRCITRAKRASTENCTHDVYRERPTVRSAIRFRPRPARPREAGGPGGATRTACPASP